MLDFDRLKIFIPVELCKIKDELFTNRLNSTISIPNEYFNNIIGLNYIGYNKDYQNVVIDITGRINATKGYLGLHRICDRGLKFFNNMEKSNVDGGTCLSWIIGGSKFLYSVLFVPKHKQSLHQTFHHNSSVRSFYQQNYMKKFARMSCEQLVVLANFLLCYSSLTSLLSKSAEPPKRGLKPVP